MENNNNNNNNNIKALPMNGKNEEQLWKEVQLLLSKIYNEKEIPQIIKEQLSLHIHQLCIFNPDQLFKKLVKEAQQWLERVKNNLLSILKKLKNNPNNNCKKKNKKQKQKTHKKKFPIQSQ